MAGRNCCNSITLQLTNFDSSIDKCQTGVMSTTCHSPTDYYQAALQYYVCRCGLFLPTE